MELVNIARNKDAKIEQLFEGFRNFGTSILAYVLMVLFIILWTILLIIPGIIAAISYSMTFFIIAEDETICAYEALKKSKEMMNGHKWKFFCLGFSFFGWFQRASTSHPLQRDRSFILASKGPLQRDRSFILFPPQGVAGLCPPAAREARRYGTTHRVWLRHPQGSRRTPLL